MYFIFHYAARCIFKTDLKMHYDKYDALQAPMV